MRYSRKEKPEVPKCQMLAANILKEYILFAFLPKLFFFLCLRQHCMELVHELNSFLVLQLGYRVVMG